MTISMEKDGPQASAWRQYVQTFVQRVPRYAVKVGRGSWTTKSKPLADRPIRAHLEGAYAVAVLGQAYPLYGVLDIDDRDKGEVERIRELLRLNTAQSMAFTSESSNSWHVLFKPEYNGRPPSIRLLNAMFRDFARRNGIEVYPQWGHAVRLPFGPNQRPADEEYRGLGSWMDALHWFGKLDEYDLKNIRQAQLSLDIPAIGRPRVESVGQAEELLEHGLQAPGTRNHAQFILALWLWRHNVPQEQAESIIWRWIQRRHNGFSRDILRQPQHVRREIGRQASTIYGRYDFGRVLPDAPAIAHDGFITKPDILEVIRLTQGRLPFARFLHRLVRFVNPRRDKLHVGVSRERLVSWAGTRTYNRVLYDLEERGVLQRRSSYLVGVYSKGIKLFWPWAHPSDAVLYDGRSVELFDDAVRLTMKPGEFRSALEAQGRDRTSIYRAVATVFERAPDSDKDIRQGKKGANGQEQGEDGEEGREVEEKGPGASKRPRGLLKSY